MATILKSNFSLFFYLKSKSKKLESKGNPYLMENHIPNFGCLILKKSQNFIRPKPYIWPFNLISLKFCL